MNISRRHFLKMGTLTGAGMALLGHPLSSMTKPLEIAQASRPDKELLSLSFDLLQTWCTGLIALQIKDAEWTGFYGGIRCPGCARIHGRVGDAIFPLMSLADRTGDQTYLDAAILLYNWMEETVSQTDGSWVNDVNISSWKGITVFGSIALAEALIHHGHLLEAKTYDAWKQRAGKAAAFLYDTFTIETGHINYPATCAYALTLLGTFLERKEYADRGRSFAHQVLEYFTKENTFLFGEGGQRHQKSPRGCLPVDLGYNVEESLPSLVMYSKLGNDDEVLEVVTNSLKTHAEFLLPDGGWDNSWGTRNFKWTYWGSRTSDGCQPAFALLADKTPEFYEVALRNTKLLSKCTHDNLLFGGPHVARHAIPPCVHHTFCHAKALATILENERFLNDLALPEKITLPREKQYGVKFFADIQTWLISTGNWRATVVGYDREFGENRRGGHATGGALTILWHSELGPIVTASMIRYQPFEGNNMQLDKDPLSMPLTPRFELSLAARKYMSICDLGADISHSQQDDEISFVAKAGLLDEDQNAITGEGVGCEIRYTFRKDEVLIHGKHDSADRSSEIAFILPIVSSNDEDVTTISGRKLHIGKSGRILAIEADTEIERMAVPATGRLFNYVPGMEALPLRIRSREFEIKIAAV